jgi:hypothetical protein
VCKRKKKGIKARWIASLFINSWLPFALSLVHYLSREPYQIHVAPQIMHAIYWIHQGVLPPSVWALYFAFVRVAVKQQKGKREQAFTSPHAHPHAPRELPPPRNATDLPISISLTPFSNTCRIVAESALLAATATTTTSSVSALAQGRSVSAVSIRHMFRAFSE